MIAQETLNEVTRRLVDQFHPHAIILFGSQARGTAHRRSDVDLIVLFDDVRDRWDLSLAMDRSVASLGVACDILVMSPDEYRSEARFPGSVARYASREGRVLHGAVA